MTAHGGNRKSDHRSRAGDKPDLLPPADDEFDAMVRRSEREMSIPLRVKAIEAWIAKIKATPEDRRNKPDVRRSKGGATFIATTTNLDAALRHCAAVMRIFSAGDFELALSSLRDLESRVQQINSRVTRTKTRVRAPGRPKGVGQKAKLLAQLESAIADLNLKPLNAAERVLMLNGERAGIPGKAKYLLRIRRERKNKS
jgi:hypothetical protein